MTLNLSSLIKVPSPAPMLYSRPLRVLAMSVV